MIVLDDVLRRQHSRCSYRRAWRARGRASTLYGRLDSSIVRRSGEGWSLAQASTSRRGLRGGEDLGRGIMLVFQLASGFDSDTGEPQTGFRRESWIGVAT